MLLVTEGEDYNHYGYNYNYGYYDYHYIILYFTVLFYKRIYILSINKECAIIMILFILIYGNSIAQSFET